MATSIGNTAAGPAICCPEEAKHPTRLIHYHTSLAMIEKMVARGLLSRADYIKACAVLNKKYGFSSDSILAEIA